MENLGTLFISLIYGKVELPEFFSRLIIYFILILAALVFNEFIILNFCGFQKYTHLFLTKEADKDLELTIYKDNENELYQEDEKNKNELYPDNDLISENLDSKNDIFNNNESRKSSLIWNRESTI